MSFFSASIALLFAALIASSAGHAQDNTPIPDGPYLGQKSPGSTPKNFAPGIVNTDISIDKEGIFAVDINTFSLIDGRDSKGIKKWTSIG